MSKSIRTVLVFLVGALVAVSGPAMADPPPHAKAHGWRAKHRGHTGYEWDLDYGIAS